MSKMIKKIDDNSSVDRELDLYISNELKAKDKVSEKVDERIDGTLKMIREQKEILVRQEHAEDSTGHDKKTRRKRMVQGVMAAASVLLIGISAWQSKAIVHAAGEMYHYIYGEGKAEVDEEETKIIYYSDKEIYLGEEWGSIKFISWYNHKLVLIRCADEFDNVLPKHLIHHREQFRYNHEEEDTYRFSSSDSENGQYQADFIKEVYDTDMEADETLTINIEGKEYTIELEKADVHQAGEVQDQIQLNLYDMSFLPLGNAGRAYYIDGHVREQFSDYSIDYTGIIDLYQNKHTVNHNAYFQFGDILYFNEEVDYNKMIVQSDIGIDFMKEMGYENLPRIELPVPESGETISLQKDYYVGTKNGNDYTIYIDRVFRNGDTFRVYFAKETGKEDAREQAQVDFNIERTYEELVKASIGTQSDKLGELTELSITLQEGTLEKLYQNHRTLPYVCTSIGYYDGEIMERNEDGSWSVWPK